MAQLHISCLCVFELAEGFSIIHKWIAVLEVINVCFQNVLKHLLQVISKPIYLFTTRVL